VTRRQLALRLHTDGLVADCFAGLGGASLGIEWALGRSPDIAINHDPEMVALHAENHPETRHFCESIWEVDPKLATGGRSVRLAWFSPDCKHFSRAKGGKPVDKKVRSLAWSVVRWARAVGPEVICLENVEEFADWGPLHPGHTNGCLGPADDSRDGRTWLCRKGCEYRRPIQSRKGVTFRRWRAKLEKLGYRVEMRLLRACDYGAPTTRKRLFLIARRDGKPIAWPSATHGPGLAPFRTAGECMDWSIPIPSIFERQKPLAEPTMRRIAHGLQRFVIDAESPYFVPDIGAAAFLVHRSNGERRGQSPRVYDIDQPLGTIVAQGQKHALVVAFLAKHFGGHGTPGSSLARPMDTITCKDHHALVRAFLVRYNGTSLAESLSQPLGTLTTRDRYGLVTVAGEQYGIADIGMRMLVPRELARAQSFPDSYVLDTAAGERVTKTAQVRGIGNSVSAKAAAAFIAENCAERKSSRRSVAA
jgi:DNA (cytosine-5)-methyltransferase 1